MKIMKFTMKQYNTESHSFNQRSGRLDGFVRQVRPVRQVRKSRKTVNPDYGLITGISRKPPVRIDFCFDHWLFCAILLT